MFFVTKKALSLLFLLISSGCCKGSYYWFARRNSQLFSCHFKGVKICCCSLANQLPKWLMSSSPKRGFSAFQACLSDGRSLAQMRSIRSELGLSSIRLMSKRWVRMLSVHRLNSTGDLPGFKSLVAKRCAARITSLLPQYSFNLIRASL